MYKPLLTADDIYKKEFKTGLRGYVIEEVDGYLDQVIKDYEGFEREIERLKKELEAAKATAPKPEERIVEAEAPVSNPSNYDMLRRISNLEKAVFGRPHQENQ
ncbi:MULTISPECIES: cell division regulator GpsB [Exiguobacterium]|uniref:Cell cycle regulator (Cytosolic adaptor for multiple cell wall enzymes) n=1 Tax=Exiguobacterium oxidotolerans TaxID=223958 RepID=A0A653ID90_9BACL|nr:MULTISPECIES: cell division regulator GpsB [Exiguobacterium]ASI35632.1 cell division protein DivIVA [Exiguobacterium sp. N4-1P]VWX37070.1 cell cycle regulator (cytosolic adaptor for multiple cell wall enzymes) [Exiguobacterium oxidotolerans]